MHTIANLTNKHHLQPLSFRLPNAPLQHLKKGSQPSENRIVQISQEKLAIHKIGESFLKNVLNDIAVYQILPFLSANDLLKISSVSKVWRRFANYEALWDQVSKNYKYPVPKELTFKAHIKEVYGSIAAIFGSIDKVLELPHYNLAEEDYLFPDEEADGEAYDLVCWQYLRSKQTEPVVKGVTRGGSHFIIIRLYKRNEESVIFYQCDETKKLKSILNATEPKFKEDEFITNPTAQQWLKTRLPSNIVY